MINVAVAKQMAPYIWADDASMAPYEKHFLTPQKVVHAILQQEVEAIVILPPKLCVDMATGTVIPLDWSFDLLMICSVLPAMGRICCYNAVV